MMDYQTVIAYAIVLWAFAIVVRALFKAFRGKATLPKCPGCKDDCGVSESTGFER